MAVEHPSLESAQCIVNIHGNEVSQADVLCNPKHPAVGILVQVTAGGLAPLICKPQADNRRNGVEMSIHERIATLLGFRSHSTVTVAPIESLQDVTATHVELSFRDQYISRDDLWRLATYELNAKPIHRGQKVGFLSAIEVTIEAIYVRGHEVLSAYYTADTRPIFRSQSSRCIICIQVSAELFQWSHLYGSLGYENVLDGFLPDLFHRWEEQKVRHLVTFVLFGRIGHDVNQTKPAQDKKSGNEAQADGIDPERGSQDFYHVLLNDAPCSDWRLLVRNLRREVRAFTYDIENYTVESGANTKSVPTISTAANGNMLEAIHLVTSYASSNGIDQDLTRTGTSLMMITAGTGLFKADFEVLRLTTDSLVGNGIGVDLVSVAPKPLHAVPVFKYQARDNTTSSQTLYALPHWADISFYAKETDTMSFKPCRNTPKPPLIDSEVSSLPLRPEDIDFERAADFERTLFGQKNMQFRAETMTYQAKNSESAEGKQAWAAFTKRSSSSSTPMPKAPSTTSHISLGAPGLGPSKAKPSTGLTVGDTPLSKVGPSTANRSSSILAQQIRTLSRKPSKQNIQPADSPVKAATDPIHIEPEVAALKALISDVVPENASASSAVGSLSSLSPWLILQNPSNPRKHNMVISNQYRIWQHVYAKSVSPDEFKWQSMCLPAQLPLTREHLPTEQDFTTDYTMNSYSITASLPLDHGQSGGTRYAFDEMIGFRLSQGFQIISYLGSHDSEDKEMDPAIDRTKPFTKYNEKPRQKITIMMALGDNLHGLMTSPSDSIKVKVYTSKTSVSSSSAKPLKTMLPYVAFIRTTISASYVRQTMVIESKRTPNDWQKIDEAVKLHRDQRSKLPGFSKSRYVLIPFEPLRSCLSAPINRKSLSDEERRIEGIQKLTQMWQKGRYISAEDRQHQASLMRTKLVSTAPAKDPNPLAIEYQTRDPSAVAMAYGTMSDSIVGGEYINQLFSESEMYHSSDFDIVKLVQHIQEAPPKGVQVKDRRWYTRTYLNCFRGDEMTNWLLRHFKDIQTREEAVVLGSDLMARGLFTHVQQRHDFRDGNYFYQIVSEYRTTEYPDTTGLFRRGFGRSVPSTPVVIAVDSPPVSARWSRSRPGRTSQSSDHDNPKPRIEKPKLELTKVLRYDLDPSRASDHAEILDIHYDRIHNPENCYHIRLEWTNATGRFIEENISRWANMLDSHGLRLVQLPMSEASVIAECHLLQVPHRVSLSLRPPSEAPVHDSCERRFYHKALIRSLGFVLDRENAESFAAARVDVVYSWGKPSYRWPQFIHKSGLVLAQIDDKGDFLLLANTLAANRRSADMTPKFDKHADSGLRGIATPRVSAMPSSPFEQASAPQETVAGIANRLEEVCSNESALKLFYQSTLQGLAEGPDAIPPIDLNG